jgi:hypothetical protein
MPIILLFIYLVNGEQCYSQTGTCSIYTNICSQTGGSCVTNCVSGCTQIGSTNGFLICINSTKSTPLLQIIYPNSCVASIYNTTDFNCNINGSGTICPYGCTNINNFCEPIDRLRNDIVCHYEEKLKCPNECYYNLSTKNCIPSSPNIVCNFIEKYMLCPSGCTYNSNTNKCISYTPGIACELSLIPQCPIRCNLNVRGDTCTETSGGGTCEKSENIQCPIGCSFNNFTNLCTITNSDLISQQNYYMSHGNNFLICEPYIKLMCPYNTYDTNHTYPSCFEITNDICRNPNNGIIQYPLRLKNKYSSIMCKYSDDYCDLNGCKKNGYIYCDKSGYNCARTVCPVESTTCCN